MKTKKLLSLLLLGMLCSIGITWAGEITVTPPALTNITTTYYGLYTMTHSSTAESNGSKISSGAITTGTKGDVITINFATTKSDMYIKSITFNSLSNGTLGSNDGSYNTSTKVFTVSGNKTSVNVVLTSSDNQKGSVKVSNVVINTGDNVVETITFTSFDSEKKTFGFTSSATTSAISSISSNNSNSVSSNILNWSGSRTLVFASSNKFKYVAFLLNDGKTYTGFSADLGTYSDNYTWTGDAKTVTFTNGTGGGKYIKNIYVITEVPGPSLSVSPATANAFTYFVGNGPSTAQTFTVTGENMTSDDITVSLNAGSSYYEISDDNTTFGISNLTIASGADVYVRLKSGLDVNASYAGTLRFANDGAEDVDIALSGSVTNPTYTVTYNLNGASGDAPTQAAQEEDAVFTLAAAPTRDFYTFGGWLCSADGLVKTAGSSYTMTAENTTFTAQWTNPQYASSLDFTAVTLGGLTGSTDISDFLASANMVASGLGTGSGWDAQTAAGKYGFWGYKLKKTGATVKFLVQGGKRVSIILGSVGADATLKKGDVSSTISAKSGDTKETVVPSFVADEDMVVSVTTSSDGTVTLKRIFIADDVTSVSGTISESGWNTFASKYPLDLSTISGGIAYYAKATSGTNVTVSSTTNKVIAGEGLMIKGVAGETFTIDVDADATAAIDGNLLRGVPVGGTVKSTDHNYVFGWPEATPANYGFYLVNSTAPTLGAGKSFLHLSADLTPASAPSFIRIVDEENNATNIEDIKSNESVVKFIENGQLLIRKDGIVYDTMGRIIR